ncbi:MAG: DEAD/DEAH box helicase [Burkholderiales bacterium]|nr:DEAD/DEAH box helicase [Burkholderiales bacterium]
MAASRAEAGGVIRAPHGSAARRTAPPPGPAGTAFHVVFLPDRAAPRFFGWGGGEADAPLFRAGGTPDRARLVDEALATHELRGLAVPLLDALPRLAAMTAAETERVVASLAAWSLAAKLALDLVGRERIVPRVAAANGATEARFAVSLALPEDAERAAGLAKSFPLAAHALPVPQPGRRHRGGRRVPEVWAPEALLRAFLDASADALVRAAVGLDTARGPGRRKAAPVPWERRFIAALAGRDAAFAPAGFSERALLRDLDTWAWPALGAEAGAPRACFRLDLPAADEAASRGGAAPADQFPLRFFLQAAEDPSLLVPAAEVLRGRGRSLARLGQSLHVAEEHLLRALAVAARIFAPVARSLRKARPEAVMLSTGEAWTFLAEGAPALAEAGMGVILPAGLTRSGRRRLRLRMRVGGEPASAAGTVAGASGLALDALLSFRWDAALGGEALSARDLAALAALKAPLVRFRGEWVAVDPAELAEIRRVVASGGGTLAAHEALAAALGGTERRSDGHLPVDVVAEGSLAQLATRLREGLAAREIAVPRDFRGTLRPYQVRGLGWLAQMAELGLGACLADDMGLGKTIQLLALLLHRRAAHPEDRRPVLLVCPTSVVGNWEREIARFAPTLPLVRHYGAERAREAAQMQAAAPGAVVITTYGLLRRDAELLAAVDWSTAALDEAQNIKNPAARTARAARSLRAGFRVALTGTPVENRLAELWSIYEFLTPRLLGPLETFRREIAAPIERHGREDVAERLTRIVRPFLLRRLKSDPAIIRDLPPKQEMKVVCTLTREQASLYQAAVDETMRRIESAEGIQRRGLVLALITALKQICNHPAHYLGEPGPLERRSGKLDRLLEMLEEVLAEGDRALVFTQFREMGERLVTALAGAFGAEVPFLHGGVARAARDAMVRRFQEDPHGPRIFVLSVKAGGTGLNLTAANHVFHFDRWWNPAVEDQATDRAYRIGQRRAVQVHKLLAAGTVEEKVDRMLEEKRDLAARIVGGGEQWITELDDRGLRELFALAPDAVIAAGEADREEADGGEPGPVSRQRGKVARVARRP